MTSCYILPASAQHAGVEMENVIITATQAEQLQKESGRNIMSVKGKLFEALPVHSIDDLLRYLPGIEVQQRGPQGSQSDIVIRGGTFQQVLIIIDGVKLNDPLTGHFNSYIPINPAEIERIEILKGSASAIYGSEAVGGVINIITKTFYHKQAEKINQYKGKIVVGEYGLLNGDAYFSHTNKNKIITAGIISNNADGQPLRGTDGFFHLSTYNIAFSQQFKKNWKLSVRTAVDFRKFNAQNYYTTFASDTAHEKVDSWWNQLNLSKKLKKGSFNFDVAYKKLRDQYWFRPSSIPNDNKTNLFISQFYYTAPLNKTNSYTTGVQLSKKQINSNDRGNHSILHGALYMIFRHNLFNNFHLNESVRLDWDENYGLVLVPQINAAWTLSKVTLRTSAGKSFRDADFTERYNNYNKTLVTSGRIGNPDLNPEQSWNAEAGIDYKATKHLKLSATYFYRNHRDLIDWANTSYADMPRKTNLVPTGSYALAKNVEKVLTTGFELDLFYNKQINTHAAFFASTGVTWLRSKNNDPVPSFYISSHARFLTNFAATYQVKAFTIGATAIYKERNVQKAAAINMEITPTYFILNSKIGYRLPKNFGKLFAAIDNLFNTQYSDLLGSKMPGRWISGGFEIDL